jgi:hypothetical protein
MNRSSFFREQEAISERRIKMSSRSATSGPNIFASADRPGAGWFQAASSRMIHPLV